MATIDLNRQMAESTKLPEDQVELLVSAMSASIREFITRLDEVAIPGFGTFTPTKYEEQVCVNPDSGKMELLPPSVVVEFKPSVVVRKKFVG